LPNIGLRPAGRPDGGPAAAGRRPPVRPAPAIPPSLRPPWWLAAGPPRPRATGWRSRWNGL